MPEEKYSLQKLILLYVQTVAILIGVLSVVVGWLSFRDQSEWNRWNHTSDLLGKFNSELNPHLEQIMSKWPDVNDTVPKNVPSIKDFDKLDVPMQLHLAAVFNYFEDVAFNWEHKLADRESIESSLIPIIVRWHRYFRNFLEAAQNKTGDLWPPLTKAVREWEGEESLKPNPEKRDGK